MLLVHDYAILGEEPDETVYQSNQPLNQHFQNFSNLLQAQKERQRSKLMNIDINQVNQSNNVIKSSARSSPRNYFVKQQVPSVEKIMEKMAIKHQSHHQIKQNKEQFYDRQIRWLNQVKCTIQTKNKDKLTQEIQQCPFKPYTSPQQQVNKENKKVNSKSIVSPQPFKKHNKRNISYSKIHLSKKASLG